MNDQIDWTTIDNARPMGLDYTTKTPPAVAFSDALGDTLAALEKHRKNQRQGKRKKAFNNAAGAVVADLLKAAQRECRRWSYRLLSTSSFTDAAVSYTDFKSVLRAAEEGDQSGAFDGGGVDGDFVGPGADHGTSVLKGTYASACGERYGKFCGHAEYRIEKSRTLVARGGNVENHKFIGAFGIVASGQNGGIACITQRNEVDAFDDARAVGIEAGNDAVGESHANGLMRRGSQSFAAGERRLCRFSRDEIA